MEVVKMKNILIGMLFAAVVFCSTNAWAVTPGSQTVTVSATVPTRAGGLTVAISKVTGTVWTANQTAISFGTLTWNSTNKIFLPDSYYAVDLGVEDNTNSAWTITHTRNSLAGQGTNINDKVNVTFVKQTSSTVGVELQKLSFADSQNISYTKAQLAGGWLRVYYGIGTGEVDTVTKIGKDATGVTPIGLDTPAGTYTGSVTLTLTAV
jgi:hypothetical protein